ncbi:type IV toxin-antitoxin system AbiEi family antitoxin domain-containing protein [Dermabacteraceae bacterium P13115]
MDRLEAAEILFDLASQQWGLVTSTQARDRGVDLPSLRRLEKSGVLARIRHGVYASSTVTQSSELEVKAHWLALRPEMMAADRTSEPSAVEAVVSHTTAAEMWGIGDLWPDGAHFTVRYRKRSRQVDVRFHRADLAEDEWVIHPSSGLPITTVARTVFDLAQAGHEPEHLRTLIYDAAHKTLLTNEGELIDYFAGCEEALGVERGDTRGLTSLLKGYFPEDREAQLISSFSNASRELKVQLDAFRKANEALRLSNPMQDYAKEYAKTLSDSESMRRIQATIRELSRNAMKKNPNVAANYINANFTSRETK